jgi:four helix bundle protein
MKEQLIARTRKIGVDIIFLLDKMPSKRSAWVVGDQIIRSSNSVGANYRAATRAKSAADFINKLKNVEEVAYETIHWLEVIEEANLLPASETNILKKELNEI